VFLKRADFSGLLKNLEENKLLLNLENFTGHCLKNPKILLKVGYSRKNIGIISIAQKMCCVLQGGPYVSERFFKNGCGIEMSQATPTKFSMLFKHNYGKLF
jgi:hypothetical protein